MAVILCVEDHAPTARVLTRLLRSWGHVVRHVDVIISACRELDGGNYDLLLSDIGLPDGPGIDVVRQAKSLGVVHAIALTAYGSAEEGLEFLRAGFGRVLVKPACPDVIREAVTAASSTCDQSKGPIDTKRIDGTEAGVNQMTFQLSVMRRGYVSQGTRENTLGTKEPWKGCDDR